MCICRRLKDTSLFGEGGDGLIFGISILRFIEFCLDQKYALKSVVF